MGESAFNGAVSQPSTVSEKDRWPDQYTYGWPEQLESAHEHQDQTDSTQNSIIHGKRQPTVVRKTLVILI